MLSSLGFLPTKGEIFRKKTTSRGFLIIFLSLSHVSLAALIPWLPDTKLLPRQFEALFVVQTENDQLGPPMLSARDSVAP